jgi:uncharacterized integral membrane protein
MKLVRRALALAIFAGLFAVAYQFGKNAEPVTVTLFGWTTPTAPAWLVLASAFGLGLLVASLVWLFQVMRLSLLARRYRKEMISLESEVHRLRNVPLTAAGAEGRRG